MVYQWNISLMTSFSLNFTRSFSAQFFWLLPWLSIQLNRPHIKHGQYKLVEPQLGHFVLFVCDLKEFSLDPCDLDFFVLRPHVSHLLELKHSGHQAQRTRPVGLGVYLALAQTQGLAQWVLEYAWLRWWTYGLAQWVLEYLGLGH